MKRSSHEMLRIREEIMEFCFAPRTIQEISKELGMTYRATWWSIQRLKEKKLIKEVRVTGANTINYIRTFNAVDEGLAHVRNYRVFIQGKSIPLDEFIAAWLPVIDGKKLAINLSKVLAYHYFNVKGSYQRDELGITPQQAKERIDNAIQVLEDSAKILRQLRMVGALWQSKNKEASAKVNKLLDVYNHDGELVSEGLIPTKRPLPDSPAIGELAGLFKPNSNSETRSQ